MTTVFDALKHIGQTPHGRIFLMNLQRSLADRLVTGASLQPVFKRFVAGDIERTGQLPASEDLLDRLRGRFINEGIWLDSVEPQVHHYHLGGLPVLARFMSYASFYRLLNSAKADYRKVPHPRPPRAADGGEIADARVVQVRDYIDSGTWKQDVREDVLDSRTACTWLTAYSALPAEARAGNAPLPDYYRDLVGLSHYGSGQHLVRLDIDLSHCHLPRSCKFRRPHGAGNGGPRFRVKYDAPDRGCGWGRTVDLSQVARRSSAPVIDGVPELVAGDFKPPMSAVSAHYIGRITSEPEREDDYFIARLGNDPIDQVIDRICQEVTCQ